jgi:hypothetical protein
MKLNFNQQAGWKTVARITGAASLLIIPWLCLAAGQSLLAEPVVTNLRAATTDADIQKALDALPDAGGEVVLPAGVIEVRQPIVLRRDHQILRGSGIKTVLRLMDNANCPVIIMGEPVNHPQKTVKDLRVSDVFIDGNRIHQSRELWQLEGEGANIRNNGITIQRVSDSTVEHVASVRCRSGGLVTTLGVMGLIVRDYEAFDNEFDGLACYLTTNCLFADLFLHDNPGAGISLDLAFNHNVISNAVLTANDLGIFMRASCENQFLNVFIRNSRHHGVFMAHSETETANGWEPAPKTECAYNAFTNLVAMHCGGAAFRVNNTTCTNNVIIRPKFIGNLKGGLSQAQPDLVLVQ